MDLVTDDLATVEILEHVQVVELPTDSRGAIGDIPAPYFARAAGSMGRWHRTALGCQRPTAVMQLTCALEYAVEGGLRCDINPLVQQVRHDLARRQLAVRRAVAQLDYLLLLRY